LLPLRRQPAFTLVTLKIAKGLLQLALELVLGQVVLPQQIAGHHETRSPLLSDQAARGCRRPIGEEKPNRAQDGRGRHERGQALTPVLRPSGKCGLITSTATTAAAIAAAAAAPAAPTAFGLGTGLVHGERA